MIRMNQVAVLVALGLLVMPIAALSQEHSHQKLESQAPLPQHQSKKVSEIMGKPTLERLDDGIRLQVWVKTQQEHKEMMSERAAPSDKEEYGRMCEGTTSRLKSHETDGHKMMGMMHDHGKSDSQSEVVEQGMMESMMAGTHHVMVLVSDEETEKRIENAEVEIRVVPLSMKKSYTVELMSMKDHSCGGFVLDEKGVYTLILITKAGEKTHVADFQYSVN